MQHEHIDFTIRNFAPEAKVTIQLWCNTASNSLVDPQSKAFHSAFKKKPPLWLLQREKIQTEPVSECIWWQSKRAETEVGATEEQTSALLQGSCRNYMSKNTFCCGDKIPILVHTCGSTERNYAFLFYY